MAWYTGYPPDFTDKGDTTSALLQKHISEFSRIYGILSNLMNPLDGHSHSGGADQGPQITTAGIADRAITRSKLAVGAAVGTKGTPAGKTDTVGYTFADDGNTGLFAEGSISSSGSDLVLRADGNQLLKLKNSDKRLYDNNNVLVPNLNDVYYAITTRASTITDNTMPGSKIVDWSMPWNKAAQIWFSGSQQGVIATGGSLGRTLTFGSVSALTQESGLGAGTYTLQGVIQSLINLSHYHGVSSVYTNCNCDCSGGCS